MKYKIDYAVQNIMQTPALGNCFLEGEIGARFDRFIFERVSGKFAIENVLREAEDYFATQYDDIYTFGYWRSEFWGKLMLSGVRCCRYTGDNNLKEDLLKSCYKMLSLQRKDGYLSTYRNSDNIYPVDTVKSAFYSGWESNYCWNVWGMKYTLWALIEAYELLEDEKILFSLQLPHTDLLKDFSDALFFRAASQLLDGDVDGAIRDRNAGLRILRKCREPLLVFVEELAICRMERKFLSLPLKTVPEKTLTAEQLQTLREISWDTGRKEQKKKFLKHDMLSILDLFQRLSAGKAGVEDIQAVLPEGRSRKGLAEFLFLRVGYDWNAASRFMQNRYWKMLNREEDLEYEKLRTGNLFFHLLDSRERAKHLTLLFTEPACWLFYSQLALDELSESLAHIGFAMELYRLEHGGKLPPAFTRDAEGKPLHSWRVLILPYLGEKEKALYEKIRLNEPWDSEWNRQFHAQMPVFYRSGTIRHWRTPDPDPVSETRLTVLLGDDGLFNDSGTGVDPAQFVKEDPERQLGKMVLVLDRCEAVCWMKPDAELRSEDLIRGWETHLEYEVLVLSPTLAVQKLLPDDIEYAPENDLMLWTAGKPSAAPKDADVPETAEAEEETE